MTAKCSGFCFITDGRFARDTSGSRKQHGGIEIMMRSLTAILLTTLFAMAAVSAANAQFTIKIPKLPKIPKVSGTTDSPRATQPNAGNSSEDNSAPDVEMIDFTTQEFNRFAGQHGTKISGYLQCYADNHNLRLSDVTVLSYAPEIFSKSRPMNEQMAEERNKLASLDALLKARFRTLPDTGRRMDQNPAIWLEITSQREEYLKCAAGEAQLTSGNAVVDSARDDIKKTLIDVQKYSPKTSLRIVDAANRQWLDRAISPYARKEYLDKWKYEMTPEIRAYFESQLDAIKAAAPKQIALFTADKINTFPYRNPAEEKMMRAKVSNVTGAVIYKIGLYQNQWLIEKNDLGLPLRRYKQGAIYARDPQADHQYCYLWYVNMIQEYAGAGTYGASYANYVGSDYVTCPVGK